MLLLVLGGLAVLAFAQRQVLGRFLAGMFNDSRPVSTQMKPHVAVRAAAPVTVAVPAPSDSVRGPEFEYWITDGPFATHAQAESERSHLASLVTCEVRVTDLNEGGHQVWLGRFVNPSDADSALADLQGRGLVPQAAVLAHVVSAEDSVTTTH